MKTQGRILLSVAYRGTKYRGWQVQPGMDTIQARLEAALGEITGAELRVHGSGRTDTGVHASGQCAHFDPPENNRMDSGAWMAALNSRLPDDIRVMQARPVSQDTHARFSARSKTYRYSFWNGDVLPPRQLGWYWHVKGRVDWQKVEQATVQLAGKHDFARLCARRGNEPTPLPDDFFSRRILDARLNCEADARHLYLTGEGFLYRMVRFIAGALIEIGRGRLALTDWPALLEGKEVWQNPKCAPPEGLSLEKVHYPLDD